MEIDYKSKLNSETPKKNISLKSEYNSKTIRVINQVKQKHFELTDKLHKLLARQLRNLQATQAIRRIQSKNSTILTKAKALNNRSVEFYNDVYESKGEIETAALNQFFNKRWAS